MALKFQGSGAPPVPPPPLVAGGHTEGLVGDFFVAQGGKANDSFTQELQKFSLRLQNPDAIALVRPILSPQEWLDDAYYSGPLARELWPQKRKDFVAIADGNNTEIILTGAIGIGKTELVKAVAKYDLYRLSCFENPQMALGISSSETLLFVLVSLNQTKAKAKLYTPLRNSIAATPYFRDHFPFDPRTVASMEFPNHVRVVPGITGEGAVHSEDVVFLAISEANFLQVVTDSKRKRGGETLDVAKDLTEATNRRMRSRFLQGDGKLPFCRIMLDSSRQYPDDFVEQRILAIQRGEVGHRAVVVSRSTWEAKAGVTDASGKPLFSGKTFTVEVGTAQKYSRIVPDDEVQFCRGQTVAVPVELRPSFEEDIEGALRDYAGLAVLTLHPLISHRESIFECVRREGEAHWTVDQTIHPFTEPSTSLKDEVRFLSDALTHLVNGKPVPKVRPNAARVLHVDVGVTGDALGLVMGHVEDMVIINRAKEGEVDVELPCSSCKGEGKIVCTRCAGTGKRKVSGTTVRCHQCMGVKSTPCPACAGTGKFGVPVLRPRVYIDLTLQVTPPPGAQIQFDDVEAFIQRLRNECGFAIPIVTADGYESTQFLQRQVSQYGAMVAEPLSVDITKEPYYALRRAVNDRTSDGRRRVSLYEYGILIKELSNVEDRPKKIDHPHGGSKDVADGLAAVVFNCERFEALQASGDTANLRFVEF